MRHRDVNQGILRAYLDRQLDLEQASAIEEHLNGLRSMPARNAGLG